MATRATRSGWICALLGLGALTVTGCRSDRNAPTPVSGEEATSPGANGGYGSSATGGGSRESERGAKGLAAGSRAASASSGAQLQGSPAEGADFGMIGILGGGKDPNAQVAPWGAAGAGAHGGAGTGLGGAALEKTGSPETAAQKLDPNARYATTYRPGGAALAALDSAVALGEVPGSYKDLVADFGGRYAPAISAPANGAALAFQVDTNRSSLAPSGGLVNVRIAIRFGDQVAARAPLPVHLVLDVSGSMQCAAIENARKAAESLVQRLEPCDDFSMVTFSSDAQVLIQDGAIGPRRAQVIAKIRDV